MSSQFEGDIQQFVAPAQPPKGIRLLVKVLSEPGLQFAWLSRWQLRLEAGGHRHGARLVHLLNLRLTGGELGHGCSIGPGLVVKHPLGVVIGGGTKIGANCTILHNVTFGDRDPISNTSGPRYPVVGNGCLIGNGATVLGPITIGDFAKVGAGAVVLRDVATNAVVVGVPAKVVG